MAKIEAGSWNGKPIAHPDHTARLDQGAHIHEFEHHLPQSEAQAKAYDDYVREQRIEAATHHLRGLKAAQAAGDDDAAEKHGVMYSWHCKAIGHEPVGAPHPDVVARMEKSPEKLYRFRPHRGDLFAVAEHHDKGGEESTKMDKSEKDEQEQKRLTLYALSLIGKAVLAKKEVLAVKKDEVAPRDASTGIAKTTPAEDTEWEADKVQAQLDSKKLKPKKPDLNHPYRKNETSMDRAMKKAEPSKKGPCRCPAYTFPHRGGSHPKCERK